MEKDPFDEQNTEDAAGQSLSQKAIKWLKKEASKRHIGNLTGINRNKNLDKAGE